MKTMTTLEKAKEALKKHILENKEQVRKDLKEIRLRSKGDSYYNYLNNVSDNYFYTKINTKPKLKYSILDQFSDYYINYITIKYLEESNWRKKPKEKELKNIKKDSLIFSRVFFFR
jgi:hypothetical protein